MRAIYRYVSWLNYIRQHGESCNNFVNVHSLLKIVPHWNGTTHRLTSSGVNLYARSR